MFCTLQSLDTVCASQPGGKPFKWYSAQQKGHSNQCLTGGDLNITTCTDGKKKKGKNGHFLLDWSFELLRDITKCIYSI